MSGSPMFIMREKDEFKTLYTNPTMLISIIAFALTLLGLALPYYAQSGTGTTIASFFTPTMDWVKVILIFCMVVLLSITLTFLFTQKKFVSANTFSSRLNKIWPICAGIFVGIVLLLFLLRNVSGTAIDVLWRVDGFSTVVQVVSILVVAVSIAIVVLNILFKNTAKLSGLLLILGCIMLVATIFQFIYCIKGSGYNSNIQFFGLGGWFVIIASLLVVGGEFYKLGWQGYNVCRHDNRFNGQSYKRDGAPPQASAGV